MPDWLDQFKQVSEMVQRDFDQNCHNNIDKGMQLDREAKKAQGNNGHDQLPEAAGKEQASTPRNGENGASRHRPSVN